MNALRTLIVEDDAMIAGLLAETLEGLGHGVCAVETNVARAVAAASRWHPDLMIVDVGLGEASGIVAVKQILSSSFVPYVFVTGSALSGLSARIRSYSESPSACRTWIKQFRRRFQRRRPATASLSKQKRIGYCRDPSRPSASHWAGVR